MSEFGNDINVPSRKGVFVPGISVEMFRNASLECVEGLLASGAMEDMTVPSAQPAIIRCKDCKHRDVETGFCEGRGWPMQ